MKRRRIVLVSWIDPCRGDAGWLEKDGFEPRFAHCQTVGFLYSERPDYICVNGSVADSDQIGETLTIPRVCITSMVTLSEEQCSPTGG